MPPVIVVGNDVFFVIFSKYFSFELKKTVPRDLHPLYPIHTFCRIIILIFTFDYAVKRRHFFVYIFCYGTALDVYKFRNSMILMACDQGHNDKRLFRHFCPNKIVFDCLYVHLLNVCVCVIFSISSIDSHCSWIRV